MYKPAGTAIKPGDDFPTTFFVYEADQPLPGRPDRGAPPEREAGKEPISQVEREVAKEPAERPELKLRADMQNPLKGVGEAESMPQATAWSPERWAETETAPQAEREVAKESISQAEREVAKESKSQAECPELKHRADLQNPQKGVGEAVPPSGGGIPVVETLARILLGTHLLDSTISVQKIDREIGIGLLLNGDLPMKRREVGDSVIYDIDKDGREVSRLVLAEGDLVPGVRVYVYRIRNGERLCLYFLAPGYRLQFIQAPGGLLLHFTPPDSTAGHPPGKPHKSKGGPKPTPKARQLQIIAGWREVEDEMTQEEYAARVGIGASTLRSWIRALGGDE